MAGPALIDPFHRALYSLLTEKIDDRIVDLANGSASPITGSSQMVAEKYAAQVAYIQALRNVLEECQRLEIEQYGTKPRTED